MGGASRGRKKPASIVAPDKTDPLVLCHQVSWRDFRWVVIQRAAWRQYGSADYPVLADFPAASLVITCRGATDPAPHLSRADVARASRHLDMVVDYHSDQPTYDADGLAICLSVCAWDAPAPTIPAPKRGITIPYCGFRGATWCDGPILHLFANKIQSWVDIGGPARLLLPVDSFLRPPPDGDPFARSTAVAAAGALEMPLAPDSEAWLGSLVEAARVYSQTRAPRHARRRIHVPGGGGDAAGRRRAAAVPQFQLSALDSRHAAALAILRMAHMEPPTIDCLLPRQTKARMSPPWRRLLQNLGIRATVSWDTGSDGDRGSCPPSLLTTEILATVIGARAPLLVRAINRAADIIPPKCLATS